jgi:hypothetical protein
LSFELAEKVVESVLYEGYILYPHRRGGVLAGKRLRGRSGIVAPRAGAATPARESGISPRARAPGPPGSTADAAELAGAGTPWAMQTECLVELPEPPAAPRSGGGRGGRAREPLRLDVRVRFLQLQARQVEEMVDAAGEIFCPVPSMTVGGETVASREEGCEVLVERPGIELEGLLEREVALPISVSGAKEIDYLYLQPAAPARPLRPPAAIAGRVVRERWGISGIVRVAAFAVAQEGMPRRLLKLRVRIENLTPMPAGSRRVRAHRLRQSLIGAHTLLALNRGAFVSLLDPPAWAASAVASCVNLHTWPVLAGPPGDRSQVLSSPIILPDHPAEVPDRPISLGEAGSEMDSPGIQQPGVMIEVSAPLAGAGASESAPRETAHDLDPAAELLAGHAPRPRSRPPGGGG